MSLRTLLVLVVIPTHVLTMTLASKLAVADEPVRCPPTAKFSLPRGALIALPKKDEGFVKCKITETEFCFGRELTEHFKVLEDTVAACKSGLEACQAENAELKQPDFFSTTEGRVVLVIIGVAVGVGTTTLIYHYAVH